jgi:hypothetical protein
MTEQTETTVDIKDPELSDFEKLLYNEHPVEEEEKKVDEIEDDSLAEENEDDNEEEVEQEDPDSEEDDEPEEPPKRRNRAQERIEKLVADVRITERERDAARLEQDLLRKEVAELRSKIEVKQIEEAPSLRDVLPDNAPKFDAVDKDGNPVYNLGEFDPLYIRDLTRFTIQEETKRAKEATAKEEAEAYVKAAREEIQTKWNSNLEQYEAEVPEIRQNLTKLVDTFSSLEPKYGEYLASVIMDSDAGPQIMDYFSQNIGEAQKIVASGPAAATRAIGRLEGKFVTSASAQDEKRNKKVSDAPPPPPKTKGSAVAKTIRPDTPNLDDFETIFYE